MAEVVYAVVYAYVRKCDMGSFVRRAMYIPQFILDDLDIEPFAKNQLSVLNALKTLRSFIP